MEERFISSETKSHETAKFLMDTLADYDLFQLEHNIKPDYSNAGGIEVFEDGEWLDCDCDECN